MRRVVTVSGIGSYADIKISATLASSSGDLMRSELTEACEDIADRLMRMLPEVNYLHVPLCHIKVKGA